MKTTVRYELQISRDFDYDIEGDFEFQEDKDAAYEHGMYGYNLLKIEESGDRENGWGEYKETDLDSCWGFIGTDDMVQAMAKQFSQYLPEGAEYTIIEMD